MEELTVWRTSDGKIHYTEKKALEHDLDRIREIISNVLEDSAKGRLTRSEQFSIVLQMIPDLESARKLITKLNNI